MQLILDCINNLLEKKRKEKKKNIYLFKKATNHM